MVYIFVGYNPYGNYGYGNGNYGYGGYGGGYGFGGYGGLGCSWYGCNYGLGAFPLFIYSDGNASSIGGNVAINCAELGSEMCKNEVNIYSFFSLDICFQFSSIEIICSNIVPISANKYIYSILSIIILFNK
jgi:hypothetical protein